MTIGVVTDSASDLPVELARAHAIAVVPLEVRLGTLDPSVLHGATGEQFWEMQKSSGALAETAAPSPGEFAEAFAERASAGCSGVVCITLSSRLSATYQAALAGASAASGIEVAVVDSATVTMGEGLLALEAAAAASTGADLATVVGRVERAISRITVLGTLDTLEYLRRGGRIGSAQAFIGSLLAIKPVVEVRDGVVEGESRQRTRSRSLRYLADKVLAAGPIERLAVVHAAAEDIDTFVEMLAPVPTRAELIVTSIGPVVGAHTGPGTIGVCIQRSDDEPD